jgi:peptidoglycan/LPS O-acetylase OafA/YrhL
MPPQVRRAIVLLWLLLIAAILAMLFAFDWTTIATDPEMASFIWPFVIGSFIVNAILIYFTGRRHNWARIILLLLTVGGLIVMVVPFDDEPRSWAAWAPDIGFAVLDLIAVYWLFTGAGAAWFSRRNERAF